MSRWTLNSALGACVAFVPSVPFKLLSKSCFGSKAPHTVTVLAGASTTTNCPTLMRERRDRIVRRERLTIVGHVYAEAVESKVLYGAI